MSSSRSICARPPRCKSSGAASCGAKSCACVQTRSRTKVPSRSSACCRGRWTRRPPSSIRFPTPGIGTTRRFGQKLPARLGRNALSKGPDAGFCEVFRERLCWHRTWFPRAMPEERSQMPATELRVTHAFAVRQRDRRLGLSDVLAALSRGLDGRLEASRLSDVFEDSLRRALPVRSIQLRDGSNRWSARVDGALGPEAIALDVPATDGSSAGVLEATFDPGN